MQISCSVCGGGARCNTHPHSGTVTCCLLYRLRPLISHKTETNQRMGSGLRITAVKEVQLFFDGTLYTAVKCVKYALEYFTVLALLLRPPLSQLRPRLCVATPPTPVATPPTPVATPPTLVASPPTPAALAASTPPAHACRYSAHDVATRPTRLLPCPCSAFLGSKSAASPPMPVSWQVVAPPHARRETRRAGIPLCLRSSLP